MATEAASGLASPPPSPPSSQENSPWPLQRLQEFVPQAISQYKTYEDAFFKKIKDAVNDASENPKVFLGGAVVAGLLLRGPRRFLIRHTLGRLQNEEAKFIKVERNLKDLGQSVASLSKDSKRLIASTDFGEEEMLRGSSKIRDTGKEIQRLVKSIYRIESEATDLMDVLRLLPGREALKLRADVASIASVLKEKRQELNGRILKMSELGIRV